MARSGSYAGAHVVEEIAEWLEQNTRTDCHSDLADSLLTAKWLGEGHSEVLHAIPRNEEFSVRAYCERLAQLWLLDQRATNATNRDAFIAEANIALGNTDALSQLGGKAEKVPTAASPTTTVATWRSVKVALAQVIAQDETDLENAKSLANEMLRTFCKGANGSTLVMNLVPSHERLTVQRFLNTSFELWTRLDGTSGTQLCEAIKSAISSVPMEHINFLEDADYNRHFRPSLPLLDDDPVDIVPRLCAILDEFVINCVADLLLLPVLKSGKGHILVKNEIPLCQQFSYHVYLSTLFTVWGRNDETSGKALHTTLQHCHDSIGEPKSFSMSDVDFLLDKTVDAVLQAPGSTEIKFHEGDWMALAHFELCGIVHGEAIRRLSYCLVQPLYSAIKGQQPMSGDASTLVLDSSPPCCDVTEKLLLWIALCIWRWHTTSPSPEGILSSLRMINFDAHQQCSRLLKHTSSILKPDADFKPEPRKVAVERVQREMVLWKDMYQRLCYSGITSREVDDLASALLTSWKQDQRRDVLELFMPRWLERTASLKLWILILMWMHTNPDEDTHRPISKAFRPINKRRLVEGKTPFQIDLAGLVDCMFLQVSSEFEHPSNRMVDIILAHSYTSVTVKDTPWPRRS